MESQQVNRVITFKPKFIEFIRDPEIIEILRDKNHFPILKLLKKSPMTVRELEEGYEEETGKKKSNKTIYRYLKTLEEAQLVRPAGNQVITGKTATETIYARTALAFYMKDDGEKWWNSESSLSLVENVGKMLGPIFSGSCDVEKLRKLMKEFSMKGEEQLEFIAEKIGDDLAKAFIDKEFDEITGALKFTSMFAALKSMPNALDEIESCFKK